MRETIDDREFLILYARSVHLALPLDATPAMAFEALKVANALPSESLTLDAPLTQGVVLRIGRAAGMKITSNSPYREFERPEAELFLASFSGLLAAHCAPKSSSGAYAASDNPPGNPLGHANTDKGKKKGRPFTSSSDPG